MKIGFIGGGQMCEGIVKGLLASRKESLLIVISEPYAPRREYLIKNFRGSNVSVNNDNNTTVSMSDVVVISVKPQSLSTIGLQHATNPATTLYISICAGIPLSRLESVLPPDSRIVRVMPNLAATVGEGASGFCMNSRCTESDGKIVIEIFQSTGAVVERVPESQMDIVTAISGSGPAYVAMLIEALADGAVKHGMARDVALRLAAQTCVGAGRLVLSGDHPAILKDKVSSPGGTTIAAVAELEKNGFRNAAISAVSAALERGKELSRL
jgi:pyrroline-5-carboxylate reductase